MIVRQYAPCSLGRSIICLGKQGEINALRVEFDVSAWMAMYPDATVKLMHFAPDRPQDKPVIPTLGVEGTLRVWIVGEEDTAGAGNGVIELLLIDERTGSTIKSATGYTTVLRSPSAGIEAQEAEAGYVRYDIDQSALLTDEQKAVARTNIDAIKDETDPTVPDWAKQPSKPTYTASEVGALPSSYTPPVTSVNGKTGEVALNAQDVGARPDTWTPSAADVGADAAGTASGAVAAHNTSGSAHSDLRALIEGLNSRLNALADSDDTTLDQLSEIVAYIKSNKALIDVVTTGKVGVSDIVDNLTTNASGKVLSAAQGVALKAMIDGIVIPTALPNPQPITINGQRYDGSEAVTVTPVEIDDTLTQSGKAADAKAVGDRLSALNEANATKDELLNQLSDDISKLGDFVEPINIYNKFFSGMESIDGKTIEYSNGYASNYAIQGTGENKGAIIDYEGRYISYPIPVHGGKTLYFYWGSSIVAYNMFFVNCYDKNMQFIERNPQAGVTSYELPKDTEYVRLMIQSDNWFTNGYQMITYSNIENTTYHRFFESFYLVNDICDVLKLGAKGDGETDDSDIIQSALDVFPVVYLPPTEKGYMISKPLVISKHSQKFYGGNHTPYYSSANDSRKSSTIRPLPTFVGKAMIIVENFAYGAELSNFALTWNSDAPDIATDGIDVGYAPDIDSVSSLGFNVLRDIFIYRLNGNGIVAHYKNWDNHFQNVHVKKCSQNGFKLDCTDSVFIGCNASDNRKNGYEVNKGACVFDACKAFCNGTIGDTDTAGFVINGQHTRLNGCNSQQNYTNGIIINSKTNSISGMVIDGNGWKNPTDYLSALKINASGNIFSSIMIIPHWLDGCVKYGIDIAEDVKNIDLVASITESWDDWTTVKDDEGNLVYADFEEFVQVSPNTKFGGNRVIINCVQQID